MADFPLSKKTFSALIDGTTYMEAVNVNTVYDEVEAVETFIGHSGAAQSHNLSILELLQNNYVGLRCYKKDDDEIYVGAGAAIISNVTASIKKLRRNTAVTTITASDIDTGALAVNYYYIYAVADASGTAIAFVISLSDSAPSGYTNYKKIGWFYNETASALDVTSGFIGNIQEGNGTLNVLQVEASDDIAITGTAWTDMTDMEIKFISNGRPVKLYFQGTFFMNDNDAFLVRFDVDGSNYGLAHHDPLTGYFYELNSRYVIKDLAAGEHTIKAQWKNTEGIGTVYQKGTIAPRILCVEEL